MTFLFIITCVTAVGYRDYKWSRIICLAVYNAASHCIRPYILYCAAKRSGDF